MCIRVIFLTNIFITNQSDMWKGVQGAVQSDQTHASPHWSTTFQVQDLREGIQAGQHIMSS